MYTIKKSYLIAIYTLIFGGYFLLVWFLLHVSQLDGRYRSKFIGSSLAIVFLIVATDYKNRSRKYIKFNEKHVRINAYHKESLLKCRDIDILYEDIRAIKVKKLPIFGITSLIIDADNYGNGIKIHRLYNNFSGMCETFYIKTRAFAPNARLDKTFIEYARRNNEN